MSSNRNSGFTLIEIMVATVILVMIVLIMAQLFHQSQVAWDSGMRKAEGNLGARAVVGFISRELQSGVFGTNAYIKVAGKFESEMIQFYTFTGTNSSANRVVRRITYSFTGTAIKRLEEICNAENNSFQPAPGQSSGGTALIEGVKNVSFELPSGVSFTNSTPPWIRIVIGMSRSDNVSGVGCRSAGPDRKLNTDDDVRSK